jgi:hypothetical protein
MRKYAYDIKIPRFMEKLILPNRRFKARVYILRCLNLSAIDSYVDFKDKMAGYSAKCSADPYPVITVGDGKK